MKWQWYFPSVCSGSENRLPTEPRESSNPMVQLFYGQVLSEGINEGNIINPLRAKLLRENINMYLHFMSFLHTNKTQVAEIPPGVRRRPAYST